MPIRLRRPLANPEAAILGTNLCSSMIRRIRSRVSEPTLGWSFHTRGTVVLDTLANRAISPKVGFPGIRTLSVHWIINRQLSNVETRYVIGFGTGYEKVY